MQKLLNLNIYVLALIYFAICSLGIGSLQLFDWDEINFAESAREMLITKNYLNVQIGFYTFWEKPPLFIWMQSFSMSIFGTNEFAARFPNALASFFTFIIIYFIGKKFKNEQFGKYAAILYAVSLLPAAYFKSGIIDPIFNLFIFSSIAVFYLFLQDGKWKWVLFAGFINGLAILTKGPVGLILAAFPLLVYLISTKRDFKMILKSLSLFSVISLFTYFLWLLPAILENGFWFLEEFMKYQVRLFSTPDAGHAQPIYYHFLVVLLGCFPASFLAMPAFKSAWKEKGFLFVNLILLSTVLILFTIVKTKIIHYSSLTYFPLAFLAAHYLSENKVGESKNLFLPKLAFIFSAIIGLAFLALAYFGINRLDFTKNLKDIFAVEAFSSNVNWSFADYLPGIIVLAILILLPVKTKFNFKPNHILGFGIAVFLGFQSLYFITLPKIQKHTQGGLVSYLKESDKQNSYINVYGFKSYAHFFYGERASNYLQNPSFREYIFRNEVDTLNSQRMLELEAEWMIYGETDKPVFEITRVDKLSGIDTAKFIEIDKTGGFVLLKKN